MAADAVCRDDLKQSRLVPLPHRLAGASAVQAHKASTDTVDDSTSDCQQASRDRSPPSSDNTEQSQPPAAVVTECCSDPVVSTCSISQLPSPTSPIGSRAQTSLPSASPDSQHWTDEISSQLCGLAVEAGQCMDKLGKLTKQEQSLVAFRMAKLKWSKVRERYNKHHGEHATIGALKMRWRRLQDRQSWLMDLVTKVERRHLTLE